MHRDVYDIHQLGVIYDAQRMTESVIDDALLQAMPHYQAYADSVLWRSMYYILSKLTPQSTGKMYWVQIKQGFSTIATTSLAGVALPFRKERK